MGVARNFEIMRRSKEQVGETACLPYSSMDDMEMREGKK